MPNHGQSPTEPCWITCQLDTWARNPPRAHELLLYSQVSSMRLDQVDSMAPHRAHQRGDDTLEAPWKIYQMRTLIPHPTTYIFGTVKYSSVTHLTGIQAIEFYMGSLSIGSTQQCGSLYDAIREQTLQSILGGVQIGWTVNSPSLQEIDPPGSNYTPQWSITVATNLAGGHVSNKLIDNEVFWEIKIKGFCEDYLR